MKFKREELRKERTTATDRQPKLTAQTTYYGRVIDMEIGEDLNFSIKFFCITAPEESGL